MAYPELETIHRRVEEALSYDLLGPAHNPSTSEEQSADTAINGHLSSPLNSEQEVEAVRRFQVDAQIAGELYARSGFTGTVCGYSFGAQNPSSAAQGSQRNRLQHILTVEVTLIRCVKGAQDLVDATSGYYLDRLSDDVATILQSGRRKAPLFGDGVQTVNLSGITRLDGGGLGAQALWAGRTHAFQFARNMRALQT